jgi:ADP-ribose pyrophosphatase
MSEPPQPRPGLPGGLQRPSDPDDPLRERVVASHVIHRGRYLELRLDEIVRADGSRAEREIVGHPGAVAVLALDEAGRVLLVRQWRVAADRALLEVPAGTLDVHDGATEDPQVAARRELEEETGHRASTWQRLASFWTAPGFATELMHLFLATGLSAADGDQLGPDDDERLELRHVDPTEALAMVGTGEIADAKTILALLWLERLRRPGEA